MQVGNEFPLAPAAGRHCTAGPSAPRQMGGTESNNSGVVSGLLIVALGLHQTCMLPLQRLLNNSRVLFKSGLVAAMLRVSMVGL